MTQISEIELVDSYHTLNISGLYARKPDRFPGCPQERCNSTVQGKCLQLVRLFPYQCSFDIERETIHDRPTFPYTHNKKCINNDTCSLEDDILNFDVNQFHL